jgi:hypothetical protein
MNIPSRKTSAIHRLPDSAGLLLLGVLCLGLITCICASTVQGGEAREIGRVEPIPRDYQTWSLFLVCSHSWLSGNEANLDELFQNFLAFGKTIGPENVAVWFWGWETLPAPYNLVKVVQTKLKQLSFYDSHIDGLKGPKTREAIQRYQESVGLIPNGELSVSLLNSLGFPYSSQFDNFVDISRNIQYCQKYGLEPSMSPYVVVTPSYPDLEADVSNFWIMRLNGLPAEEVGRLLGDLTDQLVLSRLNQEKIDSVRYWRTWEAVSRGFLQKLENVASYIKKVTVGIDTKFFKLELEVQAEP